MNSDLFVEWYMNDFISYVEKFCQVKNKCCEVMFLLANDLSHPSVEIMHKINDDFKIMYPMLFNYVKKYL